MNEWCSVTYQDTDGGYAEYFAWLDEKGYESLTPWHLLDKTKPVTFLMTGAPLKWRTLSNLDYEQLAEHLGLMYLFKMYNKLSASAYEQSRRSKPAQKKQEAPPKEVAGSRPKDTYYLKHTEDKGHAIHCSDGTRWFIGRGTLNKRRAEIMAAALDGDVHAVAFLHALLAKGD